MRRLFALLVTLTLLVTLAVPAGASHSRPPVDIQILGLNDFHGQLERIDPIASSGGRIGRLNPPLPNPVPNPAPPQFCPDVAFPGTCVPAGGVEYLATHLRNLEAGHPNSVFVSAGDLIGATPLLSALFHDEPTMEAMNLMGLDYAGVGNHEFDEGIQELLRMRYGRFPGLGYWPARADGCHPVDGCGDGDSYNGTRFRYLAANVKYRNSGLPIFPPFWIHHFSGGAKVAFIGLTLEGTPLIVSPAGIASVQFLDEVETVNRLVPILRFLGVEAIVVLLHEGGVVGTGAGNPNTGNNDSPTAINTCPAPGPTGTRGPAVDIAMGLDDEVDVVITGHTNWAIDCVIDGKVVTGAASQGRLITDIDAKIDPTTRDFVPGSFMVNNHIVTNDASVPKAADMTALIAEYNVVAGPLAAAPVGDTSVPLNRDPLDLDPLGGPAGETLLGRLIADAQLESSKAAPANAVIAFMNPGGIRANVGSGVITHGEAFAIQPFSNIVTTKTMTGAQIEMVLEQQFINVPVGAPAATVTGPERTPVILQVSAGFTYTYDMGPLAIGNRVLPGSIMLGPIVLDPTASYRVTMNSFLATGGDNFPAFTLGTAESTGLDDLVALEAYLALPANTPYVPPTDLRITRLN